MEYRIFPSDDNTYITLKFTGDIGRHTSMQHILEAHAMGRKGETLLLLRGTQRRPDPGDSSCSASCSALD